MARTPITTVNRTPILRQSKRKPVLSLETEENSSIFFDDEFKGIVPPQQRNNTEGISNIDPKNVKDYELDALRRTNLAFWVVTSGIKVDHRPIDFQNHQYIVPLYVDRSKEIVLMKSAQMGATIWLLLKLLWFAKQNQGTKACLFFPTQEGVNLLSKDRLTPLIASNDELKEAVIETDNLGYKKIGNQSSLYLRHLGGVASKDSTPFDMIAFDEVRLLNAADIDQARERVSHSSHKYVIQVSTAGAPACDIHARFLLGTQNHWYTKCNCSDNVDLSEVFPECMAITQKEIYIECPRCKKRINDPQEGCFIAHNPDAEISSYHIHQLLSRFTSPAEIWRAYTTTTNIKEFYNAKLGKPYLDEENVPVTLDDLAACENSDLIWGNAEKKKYQTAMGVDQMSGLNYIVIAQRTSNKKRVIHYEIVDSMNSIYMENGKRITPFKRLYQLMKEYDVDLCIVDAMPNANEAIDFAQAFPKRVFLSYYIEQQKEMVQWMDRTKYKVLVKKGGPRIKFKYTCFLSRYLTIDYALSEIANRNFEWPIPERLIQVCRSLETGYFEPLYIFKTHFYLHCTKIFRNKKIINEDTGQFKMEWRNLGLDPHSIHCLNYCNIALERLRKVPMFAFG